MLFDSTVEAAITRSLDQAKLADRLSYQDCYDRALQYARGDMVGDTERALLEKYPASQRGPDNQKIAAITVGLTTSYLSEMATAYSFGVTRRLIDDAGNEDVEVTKILNDAIEECGLDFALQAVEHATVLLGSCGLLLQVREGEIDPVVVPPQDIFPVAPDDDDRFCQTDQSAYRGYSIDLRHRVEMLGFSKRTYAFIQSEGTTVYEGADPTRIDKIISRERNPFVWLGKPLQMLSLWHETRPIETLLPLHRPAIVDANREMNVLWSVLLDVLRFQGGATAVRTSMNPESVQAEVPVGVRFPQILQLQETFSYANANPPIAAFLQAIQAYCKQLAMGLSLSPNDFDYARVAESGIARAIANLPKTRARSRRVKWFQAMERRYLYPRLASILAQQGKLPQARVEALRLDVQFQAMTDPVAPADTMAQEKHDLDIGITTPARILSERLGCSVEEAAKRIAEDAGMVPTAETPEKGFGAMLGRMIAGTGKDVEDEDEDEDERAKE